MRVLLLNGPPRSGKDTAGRLIEQTYYPYVTQHKFAAVVKTRCHAAYGLFDEFDLPYAADHFEHCKDEPIEPFLDTTPRSAYIDFSESFMKPRHGKAVFGRLLLENLKQEGGEGLFVITDCGFRDEAAVLVRHFGPDEVALVRLHRDGCTFAHDSRGYIDLSDMGVQPRDVNNNGTLRDLLAALRVALPEIGLQ